MKVSRGLTPHTAPPAPIVHPLIQRYNDALQQMLAQVPGHPELIEEIIMYNTLGQRDILQTYRSYADGMEYIITVENGKAILRTNTVGVR